MTTQTPDAVREASQRLHALAGGAELLQVYGPEWCLFPTAQMRADLAAILAALDSRAGDAGEGLPTADELEASGKAPWHGKQPIEDFAKQWRGRPWVPLEAAISALQFWQRRDYEHTMSAFANDAGEGKRESQSVPAGWIGWSGGVVPVQGTDARGLILFKGESVTQAEERGEEVLDYWPWHDDDGQPLATAYKIATPAPAVDAVPAGEVYSAADMLAFLKGEAPLDGHWFGDDHPKGSFWWRAHLAALSHGEGRK